MTGVGIEVAGLDDGGRSHEVEVGVEWLTTGQAADALRVTPTRVRAMLRAGRLDGVRRGRDWQVRASSVAAWVAAAPSRSRVRATTWVGLPAAPGASAVEVVSRVADDSRSDCEVWWPVVRDTLRRLGVSPEEVESLSPSAVVVLDA